MGLSDRFSSDNNSKDTNQGSNDKVETKTEIKSDGSGSGSGASDSAQSSNSTDSAGGSKAGSSSGGDGKGSSLTKNPYADNLKDVLSGKKSKAQGAMDAGKEAIKRHGGKMVGGAIKGGAKAAAPHVATGLLYLYIFQRLLNMLQMMMNAILQSPIVNILLNIIAMVMNLVQSMSGFFGAIGHAIAGVAHAIAHATSSVLNAVGGFFSGLVHAAGGGSTAASTASVGSQIITASLIPIFGLAFASGAFNDKNSDPPSSCSVDSASETPHYGRLGTAKYYKNNQTATVNSIYKALKKGGYTDKTAFALIGNWQIESHFDPTIDNGQGAHGLVQWMGSRWDTSNTQSMKWYANKNHGSMTDLGMQLNFADWELHNTHKGDLQATDKAKTLDEATKAIWASYENPGKGDPSLGKRQAAAAEWEKKIKGGSAAAIGNDIISAVEEALGCGQSVDTADWTGSIRENIGDAGSHWTWDDTPKDIKKYMHDPNDVGMKFAKGGEGWFLGGLSQGTNSNTEQCVIFAESYFLKIHGLSNKDWVNGNGQDMVSGFSSKLGGKGSGTPHQGDIAAVKGGSTDGNLEAAVDGKYYGHTFVVSHVLQNGDLIGLEQNMKFSSKPLSGTYTNTVSWDTIVLKKATYKKWGIKFYHPDAKKHPLKWSKSSGGK